MTEDKLQEIRELIRVANERPDDTLKDYRVRKVAPELLSEVDRLRAENQKQDTTLFDWDMRLRALERENAVLREYLDKLLIVLAPSGHRDSPTS